MDKTQAVRRLRALGLDSLPTTLFASPAEAQRFVLQEHHEGHLTLRTSKKGVLALNLPRLVDASPEDACRWLEQLPMSMEILIQPYEQLIASAELSICASGQYLEVVAGVWELDNNIAPVSIHIDRVLRVADVRSSSLPSLLELEPHVTSVHRFIEQRAVSLEALRTELVSLGHAIGIKLHRYSESGWSAVNVRGSAMDPCTVTKEYEDGPPPTTAVVVSVDGTISEGVKEVVVSDGVPREEASTLIALAAKLRSAGVETVYTHTGLLSHFAILLRESGLRVVRVAGERGRDQRE